MMKILITGSSGFVGINLYKYLSANTDHYLLTPSSKRCDLCCQQDTVNFFNNNSPDIVIHLAAKVGGILANRKNPAQFIYNNLIMGANIIHASYICGVKKFIMLGTVCSYPKITKVPFIEEDIWNGYPEETNAPYGIAKKTLVEMTIAYNKQYGFNVVNLIPTNMYGPHDHFNNMSNHVIPALINKILVAKENNLPNIIVWGDGNASREFLYIQDLIKCINSAINLDDNEITSTPINIGTGREITIKDLVLLLCQIMEYDGSIIWDTSLPNGQPRRCLNVDKMHNILKIKHTTDIKVGLQKTIQWYINNKDTVDAKGF